MAAAAGVATKKKGYRISIAFLFFKDRSELPARLICQNGAIGIANLDGHPVRVVRGARVVHMNGDDVNPWLQCKAHCLTP